MAQKMNEVLFQEKYREFLKLHLEQEKDYLPMENGEYQYAPMLIFLGTLLRHLKSMRN